MRWDRRVLAWFATWFASAPGVWQTLFIASAVVVAERLNPSMDPSGFWLLYWLTFYSGITQPVLAYVGMLASNKLDDLLAHLKTTAEADLEQDRAQTEMLRRLLAQVGSLGERVEAIERKLPAA